MSSRSVAAQAASRSASLGSGTWAETSCMAGASRSSPVGTPAASHTTSAPAANARGPSTPASASAGRLASAEW